MHSGQTRLVHVQEVHTCLRKRLPDPKAREDQQGEGEFDSSRSNSTVSTNSRTSTSSTNSSDSISKARTTTHPKHLHDPSHYVVLRIHTPSHGGVPIPITLVHHKHHHNLYRAHRSLNSSHDSSHPPLLLHAYGAYGSPLDPGFEPADLSLLERGFLVCVCEFVCQACL